jgi:hypothetical protein
VNYIMDKINANNGSGQPINVLGQNNGHNRAPIVSVYKTNPIDYLKNTANMQATKADGQRNQGANMAAIQADGQRNNNVKVGDSKSQTPFG